MSINATLLGQMFTFALFVWFTLRFVWPPLAHALAVRHDKIAKGLAAAELGEASFEKAKAEIAHMILEARQHAHEIVSEAKQRAEHVHFEAQQQAIEEGKALIEQAKRQIEQLQEEAKGHLRDTLADLVLRGAGQVVGRVLKPEDHSNLVAELIEQL